MALHDLIAVLEQGAVADADALRGAARAEALALEAAADERLRGRRAELATAREADRQAAVARGLIEPARDARRLVLLARARLVERVLVNARARLSEAETSAAYRESLPRVVAEALAALGAGAITLATHAGLVADLQRAVRDTRSDVTVVADQEISSGFRAKAADGRVEVDETLQGRLDRLAPDLALEIVRQAGIAA
jgi:vacuolar-type H+-ATPase subunit E/Vma4